MWSILSCTEGARTESSPGRRTVRVGAWGAAPYPMPVVGAVETGRGRGRGGTPYVGCGCDGWGGCACGRGWYEAIGTVGTAAAAAAARAIVANVGASLRFGYFAAMVMNNELMVAMSSGAIFIAVAHSFTAFTPLMASSPASDSHDASFRTLTSLFWSTSHNCCSRRAAAGCTYFANGDRFWNSPTRMPHCACSVA